MPIAFGTDAGVYPHGMNAMEFGLMTELGMSPAAALLSGTREAAKLLGVEDDVGTLEAGKVADIVAVPGNVLSDIHATEHPVFVMHLGHVWCCRRREPNAARQDLKAAGPVQYTARPAASLLWPGPVSPIRGVAQPGRALRSGRRSRRFKSCHPDH